MPLETAKQAIDSLKTSPACLAVTLLAAMFAWLVYSAMLEERKENHERELALMERCFPQNVMSTWRRDEYHRQVEQQPER